MSRKTYLGVSSIVVMILLCAGCTDATVAVETTAEATQPKSTSTNLPATPTLTPVPVTATPQPTPTLSATPVTRLPTPSPTKTFAPSATPKMTSCPGAPKSLLKPGDWAMVSTDPPLANKVRSQPGITGELIGQAQPGENVLVLDGPGCADGYTWWLVRSLAGLEGWTVEGDAEGYWLVHPIWTWHELPKPLTRGGIQTHDLRELSLSADTALVSGITSVTIPLATPLPMPQSPETPQPEDSCGSEFGTTGCAAQSFYDISGALGEYNWLWVYDLQDPLSRYYLNHMSYDDCTAALRNILDSPTIEPQYLDPFCGINGGIPLLFKAGVKPLQFTGGKGVRYLMASGNYQTVDHLEYRFQGLSDDGRYYISGLFRPILHSYIIGDRLWGSDFNWLLEWKEGQYEAAQASYDEFNERIEELLNAGAVTTYPSLEFVDEMIESIVMK